MLNRYPIFAALLMALSILCGIAPAHASAGTSAPEAEFIKSSVETPNAWRVMNIDTFPRDVMSAVAQCERDARHNGSDRLTLAHCATFQQKLEQQECETVAVADGQGYGFMNGRGRVYPGMVKRTGRSDIAVRCDLGDGIYADWFSGEPGKSCFNVGIIIGSVPVPMKMVANDPPANIIVNATPPRCRYVTRVRQSAAGNGGLFIQSLFLPGCCCVPLFTPALFLPSNGGTDNTYETTLVCDS
jgi:hypothetical protein